MQKSNKKNDHFSNKWIKPSVIALFSIMIVLNGYQVYRIAFVKHYADFPAYLAGAEGLRNGTNPYVPTAIPPYAADDIRPFIYPLFVAWLWLPFTYVPPIVASFAWYFISVVMMFYALWLCTELVGISDVTQKYLLIGIIGILFVSVFQWVLMFGQTDIFILLLLLLGAKYLAMQRSRSGAFFGAAVSAKLMPIVVLPMLVRNWKALIVGVVTIFVLCIAIPYLFAGNAIFSYYSYWYHTTLGGEMAKGDDARHSFALAGVVAQLLGYVRAPMILKLICGLVLLYFPLRLLWRQRIIPALFLSFMLIPLTSTRSEPNHLTMLVPAIMTLAAMLLKQQVFWRGKEIVLTKSQTAVGWAVIVLIQLMILWGYNALVPFDTIGMLAVFGIVFLIGQDNRTLFAPPGVIQTPVQERTHE